MGTGKGWKGGVTEKGVEKKKQVQVGVILGEKQGNGEKRRGTALVIKGGTA